MKELHRSEIIRFSKGETASIQGATLQGLYRLIQYKGEPMKTDDARYNGHKVLDIGRGEYVGIIRTGHAERFYPCVIKCLLLTTINN